MDTFPRFADGDVLIVTPHGQSWTLHSSILSRFCPTFRDLLQKSPGHVTKKQKTDGKSCLQFKLAMKVVDSFDWFVDFHSIEVHAKHNSLILPNTNGKAASGAKGEYVTTYDNLFRCFYNLEPDLEADEVLNSLTHRSSLLIQAAERLDALDPVRRSVETHLLRLGQRLWQRIAEVPLVFADIAIRMQSPTIFKEAMIHLIGTWKLPGGLGSIVITQNGSTHHAAIKELAKKKVDELDAIKREFEKKLMVFVPLTMSKQDWNGGTKAPGRATYAGEIYKWQALTLIRQYISLSLYNGVGYVAADGGAAFYRKLHAGDYLPQTEWEEFFTEFPMSHKAEQKFDVAMNEIKDEYKGLGEKLLEQNTQPMPAGTEPFEYLTVGTVDDAELPWIVAKKEKERASRASSSEPSSASRDSPVRQIKSVKKSKASKGKNGKEEATGSEPSSASRDDSPVRQAKSAKKSEASKGKNGKEEATGSEPSSASRDDSPVRQVKSAKKSKTTPAAGPSSSPRRVITFSGNTTNASSSSPLQPDGSSPSTGNSNTKNNGGKLSSKNGDPASSQVTPSGSPTKKVAGAAARKAAAAAAAAASAQNASPSVSHPPAATTSSKRTAEEAFANDDDDAEDNWVSS